MPTSIITTILNEEGTVGELLDSLVNQSQKSDEIIVVDGGSKDSTYLIAQDYANKFYYIKLFQQEGNISVGRNFAIKQAAGDIIAQIDGGCVADKDWLKNITEPFTQDKQALVVAGFYKMTGKNPKQFSFAPYLGTTKNKFNKLSFLPSGRSMAYKKSVWEKVGGYDEKLKTGEDTLFNFQIIKNQFKIVVREDALVNWELPLDYKSFFNKIRLYSKGDAEALIVWHPIQRFSSHIIKIASVYVRYAFFFVLLLFSLEDSFYLFLFMIFFPIYVFLASKKHQSAVEDSQSYVYLPLNQIISDIAVMIGFAQGFLKIPKLNIPTKLPLKQTIKPK